MASESVLLASLLAVGVKVPVQVMLSLLVIDGSVPVALSRLMSEAMNSITASEKPSVTVALSPILSAVSERVKLSTLGASVSTM